MNDFERIRAVKQAAQAQLFSIPGVHSVAIGAKIAGGRNTGELAIAVFVVKKKPLSELSPYEVIPSEIEGVKTDVIEEQRPVLHSADITSYRPLDGGIQIRAGLDINGLGTLGCIARTDEPDPKIVAITCHHVVRWGGKPTSLLVKDVAVTPKQNTLTFSGNNTTGSLVVLGMLLLPLGLGTRQDIELFWITDNTDTLATIATKVANVINGLGNPAVSATTAGTQVTITSDPNFSLVVRDCFVYDVPLPDPSSELHVSIAANAITFSGRVSGKNYGVYTSMHFGRGQPSSGVFTPLLEGDDPASVASKVAHDVNTFISGITASASDAQITITGAQYIECDISSDVRVGQPDNWCCSTCCPSCCDLIGRVIDARLDIDIALVQLDPGLKYKAEIEEIGVVSGTHTVRPDEVLVLPPKTYPVSKRGRTTGLTHGTVNYLDADGDIWVRDATGPPEKRLFHRHYKGVMKIQSTTSDPFSDGGDSGSAVVNASNEVVGILFGAVGGFDYVTPIESITKAFVAYGDLIIETATPPAVVQTVPKPAGEHAAPAAAPAGTHAIAIAANGAAGMATTPSASIGVRLREIEGEITATQAGERYAALVRRHFSEVNTLVNKNRHVATVWHRNGGPQLIQRLIQMFQRPEEALLVEIDGKPLTECLAKIQKVLMHYGSPSLSADLRTYGPGLGRLAGLTYPQILFTLQTWEGD